MCSTKAKYGGGGPEPEVVTLVIPQFLQNALGCFNSQPEEDISHIHKINLLSPMQESLYVDNEQDLKDALRQYCLYKQLCEKVDGEMKKLHLEFQLSENSIRLVRAAQENELAVFSDPKVKISPTSQEREVRPHTAPQVSLGPNMARSSSASCSRPYGMRPASAPMRQRIRQEPRYYETEGSGCCTIL